MLAAPICHTRNCKHFRGVKEEEEPVVDGVRTLGGGTVICLAYPGGIPDSIANPFGRYGNRFSPDSVNNPFGRYGSPYTLTPPSIYSGDSR